MTPRYLLLALAASGILTGQVQAQDMEAGPLWVGVGAGAGGFVAGCSGCGGLAGGAVGSVQVGYSMSERLDAVGEVAAWTSSGGGGVRDRAAVVELGVEWGFRKKSPLRLGAALGILRYTTMAYYPNASSSESAFIRPSVSIGLSYQVPIGGGWSILPGVNWSQAGPGELSINGGPSLGRFAPAVISAGFEVRWRWETVTRWPS